MSLPVTALPTDPRCVELGDGMHAVVFAGRCLICRPKPTIAGDVDDLGDTIVKQSGGIRRDRYRRPV